jgi:hypothetical protein
MNAGQNMNARSIDSISYHPTRSESSELCAMRRKALPRNEWRKSTAGALQKLGRKRFTVETYRQKNMKFS